MTGRTKGESLSMAACMVILAAMLPPVSAQAPLNDGRGSGGGTPIGCYPESFDQVAMSTDGSNFISDAVVWTGHGLQGPSGRAQPAHLTYSFPDDGTEWGLRAPFGQNELGARLAAAYGGLDLGREYIRQAITAWGALTGNIYVEVADDNSPMDNDVTRDPSRGDIRIGGYDHGPSFLAYNAFPNRPVGDGDAGGDMVVNTHYFADLFVDDPETTFRFFRHVIAHEHGHGLGYFHVAPCIGEKIMEPNVPPGGLMPIAVDEKRGGSRNYGDDLAGNKDQASAASLGVLAVGALHDLRSSFRSAILPDMSVNGAAGFDGTSNDWYRFDLQVPALVTIEANPTGGTYASGQVGFDCTVNCPAESVTGGGPCPIVADEAGDLRLELHNFLGQITASDIAPPGGTETIVSSLSAGTYWVRVVDLGPNSPENGFLQLYDLSVRTRKHFVASHGPAAPTAVAGIDKRCYLNTHCYFIGDFLSHPNDPAATGALTFDWDLDGNGTYEAQNNPRPVKTYDHSGLYDVTLRVRDSNGSADTHTIAVTVSDALGRCCFSGIQPPQLCTDVTQQECSYFEASEWTPGMTCNVVCEPDVRE